MRGGACAIARACSGAATIALSGVARRDRDGSSVFLKECKEKEICEIDLSEVRRETKLALMSC